VFGSGQNRIYRGAAVPSNNGSCRGVWIDEGFKASAKIAKVKAMSAAYLAQTIIQMGFAGKLAKIPSLQKKRPVCKLDVRRKPISSRE